MHLQMKTILYVFLCFSLVTVFLKYTNYSLAEGEALDQVIDNSSLLRAEDSSDGTLFQNTTDSPIKESEPVSETLINDLINVSESVSDTKNTALETKAKIIEKFEQGVSSIILSIENSLPKEVGRIERLNKLIEPERVYILEQVNDVFSESRVIERIKINELNLKVDNSLIRIKKILEENATVKVEITTVSGEINNFLEDYNNEVIEQVKEQKELQVNLLYEDSDKDKISNYDEVNIYGTDPHNATTIPGSLSDGQKVLLGLDPTDVTFVEIKYEDPNIFGEYTPDIFSVTSIEYVDDFSDYYGIGVPSNGDPILPTEENEKVLVFTGTAIPNSFVTLYIYSTPIVVTVKTDNKGEWKYVLDRELEDGQHTMYVATVNNSGKIIAKSNPVPFIKTASAASLNGGTLPKSTQSFWQENYSFILGLIFIIAIIGGIALIGVKKTGPDGGLNVS